MSFNAEDKVVSEIMNKVVFVIPRNQRRYVWNKNNWQELLDDIYFVSRNDNKSHFVGSVVFQDQGKENGIDYRTIIDGQQRITTITIILLVIMKLFNEMGMDDEFEGTIDYVLMKNNRNQRIAVLESDYHVSIDKLIKSTVELTDKDRKVSLSNFLSVNILDKSIDAVIESAYKYIYNNISNKIAEANDKEEELLKIRDAVINMQMVQIVSSSEEDSYTIFEILNARGQELEDYELLKNYIMRYIEPSEYRDAAKRKWESMEARLGKYLKKYIYHYALHKYKVPRNENESSYKIIKKYSKDENIGELLDDIKLKSEYYNKIVNPNTDNCSEYEITVFSYFKTKKQEQFRPLIMSLIHQKELGKLSERLYNNSLAYMYNFFICYNIIGQAKSNMLRDTILKYAYILENDYSDDKLRQFGKDLKEKIPSLESFKKSFANLGWSNHTPMYMGQDNKQRVQTTLTIIENYCSQTNKMGEFTIEHIIPDSEGEMSAHIGNLIPLEERINEKCKNLPLEEKLDKYKQSGFITARGISDRYKDKDFDIESRTDYLAKLVYNNILVLDQLDFEK